MKKIKRGFFPQIAILHLLLFIFEWVFFSGRPILVDFLQPESEKDKGENPLVDSLTMVSEWVVASKCALHGLIYVWDLKATVKNVNFDNVTEGDENKVVEQEVSLLGTLKFAETDNYYMNLGSHKGMYSTYLYIGI